MQAIKTKFNFGSISKVVTSRKAALEGLKDGQTVLVGGFGLCGTPEDLIEGVIEQGTKNLHVVSNNAGTATNGLGLLMKHGQIKRMTSSYVGENKIFEKLYLGGDLEVELTPQGTIAEKCRSGGAGIPAFFTPTGAHTWVQEGGMPISFKKGSGGKEKEIISEPKELRTYNGRDYVLEESITGDVALIKAWKADKLGNLVFRKNARNFNSDMGTAAKLVVAEVEEIVEVGEIDPDHVHLPSVFVHRVYKPEVVPEKHIERPRWNKQVEASMGIVPKNNERRDIIMRRLVKEVKNGMYVNLGIGIPVLLPSALSKDVQIFLQCENGSLGVGDYPGEEGGDPDLINAAKEPVTLIPGAANFASSMSFGMIRGGHLDLTVLGAMEISETCDISNWIIPGHMVKGMGGAMDLVAAGSRVIVVMEHCNKKGEHKLLTKNVLPMTGQGVVDMVITDMAVFEKKNGKLVLTEIAKEHTLEEVKKCTGFECNVTEADIKIF